jgi:hypothetical protein
MCAIPTLDLRFGGDSVDFYDSARWGLIPHGARAMLYYDGRFAATPADAERFGPVRWITVLGGASSALHTGAIDYEIGNLAYDGSQLRDWAAARKAMNCRARVYCSRSDAAKAWDQVHDLANCVMWIATLDNRRWPAAQLAADLQQNWHADIPVDRLWGNQFAGGMTAAYDTSQLYPGQAW